MEVQHKMHELAQKEKKDAEVANPFYTKLEDLQKVDDPSQSARAFYVSSPEPKD